MKKWTGDDEYLWSFTKGFSEMPSPAQLKASLAEQLSVEQLRAEFRRYIETKVAQELVDFYLDSLDREEIKEYFTRQAVTMRIVAQYIREGAPDQVNISGECREEILSTDVTAYDIFDRARVEVLTVMETNFQREFVETEGFRRIVDAAELEQRENRLLRAGGFLPPDAPPSPCV
ncbi:signal transducer, putative [Ectocarpus siliculosus]|uniref:Signal transducer, putative n=1 Tax=Ectocarpus siliculosus TaxID=2880 RepID=D7FU02_ECTSI|nr:signal transducer, putative [Ectocarpus siliculosus]|eukprot:CBJ31529.1 signal transducer, putative [Ectocarpus siliculosus]